MVGRLDRGGRRGLEPLRRHARAAVIADRSVVRRKRGGEHEDPRRLARQQHPRRHRLDHAVRGLPEQPDRGRRRRCCRRCVVLVDALIRLPELEHERIVAAAEQEDGPPVVRVGSRFDGGIDHRRFFPAAVQRELRSMLGADHELVHPRLRGHDPARPADREPRRLEPALLGPRRAEVEGDRRVDSFEHQPLVAVKPAGLEVVPREPSGRIGGGRLVAEAADNVGEGVAVLPHRQSGKLHAGRPVAVAGDRGVKGAMDVVGHLPGRLPRHQRRIFLGHGLVDGGRELADRPVTNERVGVVGRAEPPRAVAPHAVLAIDGGSGMVGGGILCGGILCGAAESAASENHGREHAEGDENAVGSGHGR